MQLSYSAYVVLGLIAQHGPLTPYELKAKVEDSVGYYWPIPHAQLYRDPPKLAELGLLEERAEEYGRRRRVFHLTDAGRAALTEWLTDPHTDQPENRDPSLLKLTFIDLAPAPSLTTLAETQAAQHRKWLELYHTRLASIDEHDPTKAARQRLIELGLRYERAYAEFWESMTD